jgi:hypothetical protein
MCYWPAGAMPSRCSSSCPSMTPARWSLATRRTAAARVNRDPGRCESVLADADRHQPHSLGSSPRRTLTCTPSAPRKSSSGPHSGQRRSSGIAARGCGTRCARPATARSPAGSSLTTVLEATSPGRSRSAGPKPPVESPCRSGGSRLPSVVRSRCGPCFHAATRIHAVTQPGSPPFATSRSSEP